MANKGFIEKIAGDMAESARAVREINRENMAVVRAGTRACFEAATTPDPGFEKFRQAKGIGNKAKVVLENIKEGAAENAEAERARRAEIQSHNSYRALWEGQRTRRQAIIGFSF